MAKKKAKPVAKKKVAVKKKASAKVVSIKKSVKKAAPKKSVKPVAKKKTAKKKAVSKPANRKSAVKKAAPKRSVKPVAKKKTVVKKAAKPKIIPQKITTPPVSNVQESTAEGTVNNNITNSPEQTAGHNDLNEGVRTEDPLTSFDRQQFKKATIKGDPQGKLHLSTGKRPIRPSGKKPLWNK